MKFKKLPLGILPKLVLTFLAVTLPVFIIGLFMNNSGVNIVNKQIAINVEQSNIYMLTSLEAEVLRIIQLQRVFINDTDLQALSIRSETLSDYEWTKAVNDLYSKLNLLASSSKYIKNAFIIFPKTCTKLSSTSRMGQMDISEYSVLQKYRELNSIFIYWKGHVYLPLGYPALSNTQYMLIVELSLDSIKKDLNILQGNNEKSTYLVCPQIGFIISSADKQNEPDGIKDAVNNNKKQIINDNKNYLVFQKYSSLLQWNLITTLNKENVMKPVKEFKKWYWALYLLFFCVIMYSSYSIYRLIHKPLSKLVDAFKLMEKGQLDISINKRSHDEFGYLYEQFNNMAGKVRNLIEEVYEKTIHVQKSELKQLQSQINPHFLYNSLYILYRMSQDEDYEGVSSMSKHLGDYFKFITKDRNDMILLEHELKHAITYTEIQKIRFGNRIMCTFDIDNALLSLEVPRLIIQPIIENAYVHGLRDVYEDGRIDIKIRSYMYFLVIDVEDNGKGMADEDIAELNSELQSNIPGAESYGIWNVHRRLALFCGEGSGIKVIGKQNRGLTVRLTIKTGRGMNK